MKFAPNFHTMPIDGALIASLRQSFLAAVQEGKATCDPQDLDRIKSDEFEVKKFLAAQSYDHPKRWAKGGPEVINEALKEMIATYKWRQENKVNEIYAAGPTALASEFFNPPVYCPGGTDSEGRLIGILPIDTLASLPSGGGADGLYKNFLIWFFESLAREAGARKCMFVFIGDHRRAGLTHYSCLKETSIQAECADPLIGYLNAASLIMGASMMLKPAISTMAALSSGGTLREMSYEKDESIQKLFGDKSKMADLLGGKLAVRVQVPGAKSLRELVPASKDLDSYLESRQKVADKMGGQFVTLEAGTTGAYLKHFFG